MQATTKQCPVLDAISKLSNNQDINDFNLFKRLVLKSSDLTIGKLLVCASANGILRNVEYIYPIAIKKSLITEIYNAFLIAHKNYHTGIIEFFLTNKLYSHLINELFLEPAVKQNNMVVINLLVLYSPDIKKICCDMVLLCCQLEHKNDLLSTILHYCGNITNDAKYVESLALVKNKKNLALLETFALYETNNCYEDDHKKSLKTRNQYLKSRYGYTKSTKTKKRSSKSTKTPKSAELTEKITELKEQLTNFKNQYLQLTTNESDLQEREIKLNDKELELQDREINLREREIALRNREISLQKREIMIGKKIIKEYDFHNNWKKVLEELKSKFNKNAMEQLDDIDSLDFDTGCRVTDQPLSELDQCDKQDILDVNIDQNAE